MEKIHCGQQSTSIGLANTLVSAKPPCVF